MKGKELAQKTLAELVKLEKKTLRTIGKTHVNVKQIVMVYLEETIKRAEEKKEELTKEEMLEFESTVECLEEILKELALISSVVESYRKHLSDYVKPYSNLIRTRKVIEREKA